ncbi:hypothetical protein F0562_025976 [Nyssa sinensis]|uniref:PB1 domain-containing protein n=1 Tax=Nyssa sinensis TaxID=561372 RepID=A0A5J5B9H5_9ASTE|nr:hypothetical protein F0562_025976 [Nyssa sinensis]
MEEEPYSDDKYQGADPDDFLSNFKEKLFCYCPTSYKELWVFWNPTDYSFCLPPPDSVGVKDRIKSVLLKLLFEDFHPSILIQFWVAITTEGQCYLTTLEQPFALSEKFYGIDEDLCLYRNNSVQYNLFVDAGSEEEVEFPAHVFRQQLLEWTPDVRYYSIKLHPRCNRDIYHNVLSLSLVALPVFDPSGKCCAGVLELVSPFFCYEVDAVCKALEIRNKALQRALDDIMKLLEVVCETHELPFAQTWLPCKQCNSEAISSFRNKSPRVTLSNISDAHFLYDFDVLKIQSSFGPHLKIDKVNYSLSNMEPACSNMPRGQAMATAAHMMPHVTTIQDVKTVDIKAAYNDGTLIRFKLPPTARMVKLEEEIVRRLTFLQVGCFKVTYLDEENDSILLGCDTDLQNYISTSIAAGITKIKMSIELETNRQA